jgi:4-alpha-glucanotransferase
LERAAGIVIPLFSLNTDHNLGRGEILELIPFSELARETGHRVIQLLPLGETTPNEASPYNALGVFAIDPLYISLTPKSRAKSSARRSQEEQAALVMASSQFATARRLARPGRLSIRARVLEAKQPLLEIAFRQFETETPIRERARLDDYIETNREWLDDYALFRALKEHFQWSNWEEWPQELKNREPTALAAVRAELASKSRMYCYWQFVAHRQWASMRDALRLRGVKIGGDLAFSPSRDSADVWSNQHLFDLKRSVGTPPDAFSASGQRWGLPMPNWPRMREDGFAWWRMRVRSARQLYDFFRIDHVVGLYRTFSFPADGDEEAEGSFFPSDEAAQLEQGEALLKAIKEEASPAEVIAEDLGTIPAWVRKSLERLGIPGYKVLRWEKQWETDDQKFVPPAEYPENSVATTGTHDTESLAMWWESTSAEERKNLLEAVGAEHIDLNQPVLTPATLDALLKSLYESPSRLVLIPFQDLFGWTSRINLPGTISDANWAYRMPMTIDQMRTNPTIKARMARLKKMVEKAGR